MVVQVWLRTEICRNLSMNVAGFRFPSFFDSFSSLSYTESSNMVFSEFKIGKNRIFLKNDLNFSLTMLS